MSNRLKNKKLLILGGSRDEVSLVQRAKEKGIYTIVADYYLDRKISPAKEVADEAWDVSWSDLDKLEKLCKINKIDGVTAGYSEFRIENLIKLCQRLELPCYLNMEQLDITRNKNKFKEFCRKYNIPVVKEYNLIEEVKKFPVIVKPVDRGGSIGISVAKNYKELEKAYNYAMECSVCKEVIIEDFIIDAIKIDIGYAILDGKIQLLISDDVYHSPKNNCNKVVQNTWFFPSRKEDIYRKKIDPLMQKMIEGVGIKDGYIFISGFVNEKNEFVFFETGFRLSGCHVYSFVPQHKMINILDIFINHALLGHTNNLKLTKNNNSNLRHVAVNIYAKEGEVDTILGLDKIKQVKNLSFELISTYKGQKCTEDKAILTKLGMFIFSDCESEELAKSVNYTNKTFKVLSNLGKDMIYDRTNSEIVKTWWEF